MSYLNASVNSTIAFDTITLGPLEKVIMSFKSSSPGYDNKCMKKYKVNFDVKGKTVLLVINLSWMQGKSPSELKIAKKKTAVFVSGEGNEIAK